MLKSIGTRPPRCATPRHTAKRRFDDRVLAIETTRTPTLTPKTTLTPALSAPRPLQALAALDVLDLPPELDGRHGTNRAHGHRQIAAPDDGQALRAWLARVADTQTTFENYRKEAERLLLWSIVQLGKPLSSLTHEDLLAYRRFLADPQPRERWVADGGRKFPRHDPRWRPFYGALAATSQRQAMVIVNALFAWLVDARLPGRQALSSC